MLEDFGITEEAIHSVLSQVPAAEIQLPDDPLDFENNDKSLCDIPKVDNELETEKEKENEM